MHEGYVPKFICNGCKERLAYIEDIEVYVRIDILDSVNSTSNDVSLFVSRRISLIVFMFFKPMFFFQGTYTINLFFIIASDFPETHFNLFNAFSIISRLSIIVRFNISNFCIISTIKQKYMLNYF